MAGNSSLKAPDTITDVGRPSKFTPERRAAIVDAIRNRIPYEYAAEANGICEETLYDWLRTAKVHRRDGIDSDYTQFSEDIKRAEMQRIREHTDIIAARPERWQADAWLLERRWHKHFGPNAQLNELNQRLAKLQDGDLGHEERSKEDGQEGI
jgi:transposase-like protein